ncbi:MAG TPA: S9 family peptidase, partial [Bacteroidales bacterium]|nr:S9 family peptidase [Bacteroidales bacterium]
MKQIIFFYLVIFFNLISFSQNKLTLEDIWITYKYFPHAIDDIQSSNDGKTYTILTLRSKIERYGYNKGKFIETVFSLSDIKGKDTPQSIYRYDFSKDETKILFSSNVEHVYRHSYLANFYVWNIKAKKLLPVYTKAKQQAASFSPDGKKVAFVFDNNLYINN